MYFEMFAYWHAQEWLSLGHHLFQFIVYSKQESMKCANIVTDSD